MQKSGIIVVASGALIVIGLILLVVGNQIILEGINQGDQKISLEQLFSISADFDMQETKVGIFAIQIIDFKEDIFSFKILNPSDIEIISQRINQEVIEKEFDILDDGVYKLIIESSSNNENQVFGAIGPLPDASKKSFGFIPIIVIIIGMAGLVGLGIYEIINRKKSI